MSSSESAARERVGHVLKEKWRLDALLGIGGMAWVYAATHRNKNRVAIKLLVPSLSHDPDVRRRFQREGYAANSIGHPGAVRVFDDDVTEDGLAFLVMELLDGTTLADMRKREGGRLPPKLVLGYMDAVLDVLAAAHEKGVIHRDIKPGNVFVTRSGEVKVVDFGIARVREGEQEHETTQTGYMLGSTPFMSPEQARGRWELVDARTDIWAVGASIFQLLSGRPVHEAATANERLALAIASPARSLGAVVPGLPSGLVALVDRALAYDPAARWQSAREMQTALRQTVSKLGALASTLVMSDPEENRVAPVAPSAPAMGSAPVVQSAPFAGRSSPLASTQVYGTPGDPSAGTVSSPIASATPLAAPAPAQAAPAPSPPRGPSPYSRPQWPHSAARKAPAPIAARPEPPDPVDVGTEAASSMARDRGARPRRRSPALVVGVALALLGAALLGLAAFGLWMVARGRTAREAVEPPALPAPPAVSLAPAEPPASATALEPAPSASAASSTTAAVAAPEPPPRTTSAVTGPSKAAPSTTKKKTVSPDDYR